jgi:diguanylate cyclase (GGDEF)-like protein/PAS domain S-box-containing protein
MFHAVTDLERERLKALHDLRVLDTPPEKEFDEIARLASRVLGMPRAAISLIDGKRQWYKARIGIEAEEARREDSFCTHTVAQGSFLEVVDATADPRFENGRYVAGAPGIRYYAGAPLITVAGHCLGALCIFDTQARPPLSPSQRDILEDLARLAVERIETRTLRLESQIAARVIDTTSDAVLAVGHDGVLTAWNRAAERMFGYPAEHAIGRGLELILPAGPSAEAHYMGFARSVLGADPTLIGKTVELTARRAGDEEFPIELSLARWAGTSPEEDGGFAAIIRDISPRRALEAERDHARRFLRTVVDHLPAMLFVKDSISREYLLWNNAAEALFGRPAADIVGQVDTKLFPAGAAYRDRDSSALASGSIETYESAFERPDGRAVTVVTKRLIVDAPEPGRKYIVGLVEDVTDLRRSQDRVSRLALYDPLTGLFNRTSFTDRLEALIAERRSLAILTIDLDRFKAVNDQFGHLTGDMLLVEVGNRLRHLLGSDDMVARIGGDEFAVIAVLGAQRAARARGLSEAIADALARPYAIGGFAAHSGASIGIVLSPEDGSTVDGLRQAGDLALRAAKALGRGGVCFFNAEMDLAVKDRRVLESDLRIAVRNGDIHVHYQPVVAADTGKVASFEALARWTHPVRGAIGPDIFIGIAEESGLVAELGARVLAIACHDAAAWPEHLRIAVNLSPMQFESHDLVDTIARALTASGLAANRLQLEVTEGLVIRDVDNSFRILAELRALGVQILMDDFGIGYSSLSYFERFPFDKVKIDRSFVTKMATVPAARAIIEAVVGLGRTLGMGIVAEGVETEAQRDALTAIGCTHLQGYLFGRPQPVEAYGDMLTPDGVD